MTKESSTSKYFSVDLIRSIHWYFINSFKARTSLFNSKFHPESEIVLILDIAIFNSFYLKCFPCANSFFCLLYLCFSLLFSSYFNSSLLLYLDSEMFHMKHKEKTDKQTGTLESALVTMVTVLLWLPESVFKLQLLARS